MNNILRLKDFLNETIKASEAYDEIDSINTVINGKRDLAFLVLTTQRLIDPRPSIEALKFAIDNGLNLLPVKNRSEGVAFVLYKNDLSSAQKLADFASKKNGYLNDETPEEAMFIGKALNYDEADIESYINRKYSGN